MRNHLERYQEGRLYGLLHATYRGSDCELTEMDSAILDAHFRNQLFRTLNVFMAPSARNRRVENTIFKVPGR